MSGTGLARAQGAASGATQPLWGAHADIVGRTAQEHSAAGVEFFVPMLQDQDSLIFIDAGINGDFDSEVYGTFGVARHYPIVFATAGEFLPLAVLGLSNGENLFVDTAGAWEPGIYVPSYVRRYPFVFATGEDQGRLTLCVDRAAGRIVEDGGEKLFADGKPTKVTDNALEFCAAFEREIAATRKIVELLRKHGLLTENQATLTLPSGSKVALKDFMVIDTAAVDRLSDDGFAELRHNGALPLVFAQIASLPGWGDLARRLPAANAAAQPA